MKFNTVKQKQEVTLDYESLLADVTSIDVSSELNASFVALENLDMLLTKLDDSSMDAKKLLAIADLDGGLSSCISDWKSKSPEVVQQELLAIYDQQTVVAMEGLLDFFKRVGERFTLFFAGHAKKAEVIKKLLGPVTPEQMKKVENYEVNYSIYDSKSVETGLSKTAETIKGYITLFALWNSMIQEFNKWFRTIRTKEKNVREQITEFKKKASAIQDKTMELVDAFRMDKVSGKGRTYAELGLTFQKLKKYADWYSKISVEDLKKLDKLRAESDYIAHDTIEYYYNGVKVAEIRNVYRSFGEAARQICHGSAIVTTFIAELENTLYRAANRL